MVTREEMKNLLNKLIKIEEKNDIGNLTRSERADFQLWIKEITETLEQQDILDKIRAEIEQGYCVVNNDYDHGRNNGLFMATQIIDKYKQESGGERMTNEQAKDIIEKYLALDSDVDSEYIQAQKVAVKALEKEPKTAIWLDWTDDRNDYLKCSRCGYGEEGEVKFGEYTPYCPMCGAKMESEE